MLMMEYMDLLFNPQAKLILGRSRQSVNISVYISANFGLFEKLSLHCHMIDFSDLLGQDF